MLSSQSWNQCISEILAPDVLDGRYVTNTGPNLGSFQYAQQNIEQWMAGGIVSEGTDTGTSFQKEYDCYGTVSFAFVIRLIRDWTMLRIFTYLFTQYSQIFRASMKLLGNMLDLDNKLSVVAPSPIAGHAQLNLVRFETQYRITFLDGTVLGEINLQLEEALNSIFEQQYSLEFEVFAPIRAIRETISKSTKETDAIARVQINIYGGSTASKTVGRELSQRKFYLQRPEYVRSGAAYDNPHVLKLENFGVIETSQTLDVVEPIVEKATAQIVKETVTGVYSALTRSQNLIALEGDRRLRTALLS